MPLELKPSLVPEVSLEEPSFISPSRDVMEALILPEISQSTTLVESPTSSEVSVTSTLTTQDEFNEGIISDMDSYDGDIAKISPSEKFWLNQRDWLETQGYRLRRRYQADWRPSWDVDSVIWPTTEDSLKPRRTLMDATRISDNTTVMLKRVWKRSGVMELNLNKLFRAEEYACDPANHCSSYTELLEVPGHDGLFVMVMPFLRPYNNPEFLAIHECLDFFQQLFEGVAFLHRHCIAHRDLHAGNIMMDASELYPEGFHPIDIIRSRDYKGKAKQYFTRSEKRPKYYIIDFGISEQYNSISSVSDFPIMGGDKSVPEFQGEGRYKKQNPFPTDIYYIGNLIQTDFLDVSTFVLYRYCNLVFIRNLVDKMRSPDPANRPSIEVVLRDFEVIRNSLAPSLLRSRCLKHSERNILMAPIWLYRNLRHEIRQRTSHLQFQIPSFVSRNTSTCAKSRNNAWSALQNIHESCKNMVEQTTSLYSWSFQTGSTDRHK
ncbi:hypothetical protein M422DRAFT_219243, partial [Sphaerobolus stellatus SS14]